ncbi:MAG: hypothetical protein ABSA97_05705 [Verrucomicrobiia bacterium]|jgi:hypothetical protein
MSELVQVPIEKRVFERLQKLATPLVDNPSSVITRLIDLWEKVNQANKPAPIQLGAARYFVCSRGERLPVGILLRATYLRRKFEARVEPSGIVFEGKSYDNPSSAGIEAKKRDGATGNKASTNGWTFWEYLDEVSGHWRSLDDFRKNEGHEQIGLSRN